MRGFNTIKRLLRDKRGATAIEYGLIISLIVIAIVASINSFAGQEVTMWNNVSSQASTAMSGAGA